MVIVVQDIKRRKTGRIFLGCHVDFHRIAHHASFLDFKEIRLDEYKLEVIEDTTVNVEDESIKKYQYEILYAALAQLDEDEKEIVKSLYWDMLSQREVGERSSETQQSISKKNYGILEKLTNLMSFQK